MNGHKRRTLKKKSDILNATKTLIATKKLTEITIMDIAKSAQVSQVTIYKLFENKKKCLQEALKSIAYENVQDIYHVLIQNTSYLERIALYFKTSYKNTTHYYQINAINDYIFSGNDPEIKDYVLSLFKMTTPMLAKLYEDGIACGEIRSEISLDAFLSMLDLYANIPPRFYKKQEDMERLIHSFIKSFS